MTSGIKRPACLDYETYSEAGYVFHTERGHFVPVNSSGPAGLPYVGGPAYAAHPSTRILCAAYDLFDSRGLRLWLPEMPPPADLIQHVNTGGLVQAWNSGFEWYIWNWVSNWGPLPIDQTRCTMSRARAYSLPGKLANAALVLGGAQKIDDGKRLVNKFSKPRKPTKNNPELSILPNREPPEAAKLYAYNMQDVRAESGLAQKLPELSPDELALWQLDQRINTRGVHVDRESLINCRLIVDKTFAKYTAELQRITGGAIQAAAQVGALQQWLHGQGVTLPNIQKDTVEDALKTSELPANCRRVLEIRQSLGSAAIKKLESLYYHLCPDSRVRDLFAYHGAGTGRFAGRGPQPQNLPNSGPTVAKCPQGHIFAVPLCPACQIPGEPAEWDIDAVEFALRVINTGILETVEAWFGDSLAVISGCLRGLFTAAPGYDLLCSDYSAIEAVVLAELAGETWRQEVFRTHGMIYEMSAAKISGVPFAEFLAHKERHGTHHPLRKQLGKFAELASGYQGWTGAWKQFGADEFMTDAEIETNVKKWREDSPAIVAYWGDLETAAIAAIENPGVLFEHRGIGYQVDPVGDVLHCILLSGRHLHYHEPHVVTGPDRYGRIKTQIHYSGWNTNPQKGPMGWIPLETYGGKLVENVTQATARDILTFAMLNCPDPIVLHIHDEIVEEVPEGTGSIEELEKVMGTLPPWCAGWPIKASGGWRGKRYRKG